MTAIRSSEIEIPLHGSLPLDDTLWETCQRHRINESRGSTPSQQSRYQSKSRGINHYHHPNRTFASTCVRVHRVRRFAMPESCRWPFIRASDYGSGGSQLRHIDRSRLRVLALAGPRPGASDSAATLASDTLSRALG